MRSSRVSHRRLQLRRPRRRTPASASCGSRTATQRKDPASGEGGGGPRHRGFSGIKEAMLCVFTPPAAVRSSATSSGFDMQLRTAAVWVTTALIAAAQPAPGSGAERPAVARVRPNGQDDTPQFKIDIDQAKAAALGLSLADVNATLATALAVSPT